MAPKRGSTKKISPSPAVISEVMKKIAPNPLTGKVDILDVVRYMEQSDTNELADLVDKVNKLSTSRPPVDLKTFDYKALSRTIVHQSFWVLQLEHWGYVDKSGKEIEPSRAQGSSGARPTFMMYCYEDSGAYRATRQTIGLPDSDVVLEVIRTAIAFPEVPLKPCLPWFFLLSIKLAQHADALRPFMDSLPKPFHWRIETREEAEGVIEGVDNLNKEGKQNGMMLAEKAKGEGNKAFIAKDRVAALKAYKEAIGFINYVLSQKPDEREEKEVQKLRAMCFANRAAAYLLPGEGMDAMKALEDGKVAENADPSYGKAYIRQASALQALGKLEEARDIVARALKRKDLENDVGLVERLIELVTDGHGFSDDEETFKNLMLDLLTNDKKSSERLSGIGGLWRKRCNEQFKRFKR